MDANFLKPTLTRVPNSEFKTKIDPTSLLSLLSFKDKSTHEHSYRVYEITREWMMALQEYQPALEVAALLHDVGKVGVLDEILQKQGFLSAEERVQMQLHAELGYQLVRDFPGGSEIAEGVRYHHERWDGKGYPLGLKGSDIPRSARIIAIVDAFDAMTSDRPYRKAMSEAEAIAEIENEAGRQFCPDLAQKFIRFIQARKT